MKNGVRESKERDINVTMEREYHIISGTNPLSHHSGHPQLYFIHSLWNFSFGSLCFTS